MPLTRSPFQSPTSPLAAGVTAGRGQRPEITSLVTVAAGNSIAAASQYLYAGSSGWQYKAELQVANILAGAPMRFGTITASTRSDRYGVYGYSGQTLDTITTDMQAQWITPVNTAGVVPGLVVGLALLENDIAAGVSVATMQSRLDAWISAVQTAWPSAKILLCTPRPSFSYNTGTLVSNYQAMRDYTLAKDNGSTIFVARMDPYEDSANPGIPLAGYTDVSVHPNAKGAMLNARNLATTLRRLGRPVQPETATTRTLAGSVAATGTNVSGTMPTGCGFAGTLNGAYVSTALSPGWRVAVNNSAAGTNVDLSTFNTGAGAASSPAKVSAYARVRIISGGENLRSLSLEPRIVDGGGNTFRLHMQMTTGDVDMDYQNGDVLTFLCPPMAPNSGAISQVTCYIRPYMKNTTSPVVVEVEAAGFYTVT